MTDILLRALLRTRFNAFVHKTFNTVSPGTAYMHNWHIDAIVHQLMRVSSGLERRLLINQPPRSLKSICVSVAYPAWLLGHDPARRIVVVSYSGELAADLHRQFRAVVESDWYRELFPNTHWTKATGLEFATTQGGHRYATSVGGTFTGRGADLIIVDDPLNASEALSEPARNTVLQWYGSNLVSRLNDKDKGTIIVLAQRLHEDDLPGHLLRQGGWKHLNLPAIAPEPEMIELADGRRHIREAGTPLHPARESLETLARVKAEIGSLLFSAQYQQEPIPAEGNLIRRSWFRSYEVPPERHPHMRVVQSWDVASTTGSNSDYSVCTTWLPVKNDYYLIHVFRDRLAYPDLRRKVLALAAEYEAATVLIEDAGPGLQLLQDLRSNLPKGWSYPIGMKPEGSKPERMAAQSAKIEAGHVILPKEAHWLDTFLTEVLAFPHGRHDDQVDSLSQFLIWAQQDGYRSNIAMTGPIIVTAPRDDHWSPPVNW